MSNCRTSLQDVFVHVLYNESLYECTCIPAERSSKALEELQLAGMGRPNPAETRSGDTAILNVVEAYCSSGRFKSLIRKPQERMYMYACVFCFTCTCLQMLTVHHVNIHVVCVYTFLLVLHYRLVVQS